MAKKKSAPPVASGGARLKAAGKRAMLLGWTPEQFAKIEEAAQAGTLPKPLTVFVMEAALEKAEKILKILAK